MKTKNNPFLFAVIGAIIMGGLFFLFKPNATQTPQPQTGASLSPDTASPTPETNVKVFELVVQNKEVVTGPSTLSVNEGDEVSIKITADEEEEFHIHGYDEFVDLVPDTQVELSFTADLSGRFPFELEHSATELGALEVQPK